MAASSVVAILGGFIVSRLISINSSRISVIGKIKEIEEQQAFKQDELNRLQDGQKESAALDFISKNAASLLQRNELDAVYRDDIQQELLLEDLKPYWNRALNLLGELVNKAKNDSEHIYLKENNLPKPYATKYSSDDFAYSVGEIIMKEIKKQSRDKFSPYNFDVGISYSNNMLSTINDKRISDLELELKWLKYQRKQLLDEKQTLKKPKGMSAGLAIFAFIAVFCIIIPLLLSPLEVDDYCIFLWYKYSAIFAFTVGLLSIFLYLLMLLKWKNDQK